MSKTPRTDEIDIALHVRGVLSDRYSEMLEHARKLETELYEMEHVLKAIKEMKNTKET